MLFETMKQRHFILYFPLALISGGWYEVSSFCRQSIKSWKRKGDADVTSDIRRVQTLAKELYGAMDAAKEDFNNVVTSFVDLYSHEDGKGEDEDDGGECGYVEPAADVYAKMDACVQTVGVEALKVKAKIEKNPEADPCELCVLVVVCCWIFDLSNLISYSFFLSQCWLCCLWLRWTKCCRMKSTCLSG